MKIDINNNKNIKNNKTIFSTITYEDTLFYIIYIICLIIWIILIIFYRNNLVSNKNKDDIRFTIILLIISLYPFIIFITSMYNVYKSKTLMGISPFFPICISGYNTLTEEEKKVNIVAKVDYKCWQKQHKFLFDSANLISDKSNYAIRILFAIIIFLFGSSKIYTYQYKLITKNNNFIKSLIQGACISGLILLSSKFLGQDYNYLSILFRTFFDNLLHINIATLIILIAYLLYNLIILYF